MVIPKIIAAALAGIMALAGTAGQASAQSADTGPLQLETKIPLGDVRGRIDHMAVDLKRQRLFVAELGNDSVGIVDLPNRKLISRIPGLKEPQGVGYEPSTDMLYVANAGDGSVRLFAGSDYKTAGRIELGGDADNIRVDTAAKRVLIGYGSGALAVIDPSTRGKVGDISLKAHPEAFQIDPDTSQIFVNVPDARGIAVVDRVSQKQIGEWPLADRGANFPMALECFGSERSVVSTDRAYPHGFRRTHFALCTRDGSSACGCPCEFGRGSRHLDVPTNTLSQSPRH